MKRILKSMFVCVYAQVAETVISWFSLKPRYESGLSKDFQGNWKEESQKNF